MKRLTRRGSFEPIVTVLNVMTLTVAIFLWVPTTRAFFRSIPLQNRRVLCPTGTNHKEMTCRQDATFLHSLSFPNIGLFGKDTTTNIHRNAARKISQELLELLLARRRGTMSHSDLSDSKIRDMIEQLSNQQVSFDPEQCLNGPRFVVLYQQGPKVPLWEKIGFLKPKQGASSNRNIQGQQYISISSEENVEGDFKVINYAEIFGKDFYIQVEGYAGTKDSSTTTSENEPLVTGSKSNNFFNLLAPRQQQPSNFIKCPWECVATVTGGGLYARGNKVLNLPISGSGITRVLYADPNLRIFESVSENSGGWENQGLVVVQVREDLLN